MININDKEQNMKIYVGTTIIKAKPMNRLDYNNFRGWVVPSDENGDDEGYVIENKGYVTWLPNEQFNNTYNEVDLSILND